MKKIFSLFIVLIISLSFFNTTFSANPIFSNTTETNPYKQNCDGWDCLKEWLDSVNTIEAVETERTASQYIQDIVQYLLTFLMLISVIIIIYAWFNLLIWVWDEEKAKKTKQIIIYAIVWLIIIFLAWPISEFIFNVLNS